MDQRLPDATRARVPEPPVSEPASGVALGVAMVVPMLLCCALPLLLAVGVGSVVGAAGSWLAGLGGIDIAAGALVVGSVAYGFFRWHQAGQGRDGAQAACAWPGAACADGFRREAVAPHPSEAVASRDSPATGKPSDCETGLEQPRRPAREGVPS